jgi:phytoene desaturase
MARLARQLGAEIRCGEPVTKIQFQDKRATGVESSLGAYPCDALVINADFARTMTDLVPDPLRRGWTNRRIEAKKFSCSTFMLYLGLKGRQDQLPHHTTYLSRNYPQNLKDIEEGRLSEDPSFYVQNACVTDSSLAPAGFSTLYVLVPVPHQTRQIDWNREKAGFRQLILSQLSKLGVEDVESRIVAELVYTPADWEASGIYRGATFNLAHTLKQMLHRRPRNRFEDLESVYLVGGGTHPGSGLPTIYSSARITSELLLNDLQTTSPEVRHRPRNKRPLRNASMPVSQTN